MPSVSIPFTFQDGGPPIPRMASLTLTPGTPRPSVVILLHGLGNDKRAMSKPEIFDLHYAHGGPAPARKRLGNWHWLPAVGPAPVAPVLDDKLRLGQQRTGWEMFLVGKGFRTVNYSQTDADGSLRRPVLELAALIQKLNTLPELVNANFVLLCHSRGGLLARQFLKDNFSNSSLLARISKVITLHSPHQGSMMASDSATGGNLLQAAVDAFVANTPGPAGQLVAGTIAPLIDWFSSPGRSELQVNSPFLAALANGETAVPGVQYHTFGGTSVRLSRVWAWAYTADSAIPARFKRPSFRHSAIPIEVPGISPILDSFPNAQLEFTEGKGDILVANSRAHLPFSTQHSNGLNHVEALYDPTLQNQVLGLL